MGLRIDSRRAWLGALAATALVGAAGCGADDPNAAGVEAPIVDSDAPKSSEEAAEQSEPPPIEYKGRAKKSR